MTDAKFGWTDFYMEFADKLLVHRGDRMPLVEAVHQTFAHPDLRFPLTDQFPDGSDGPLQNICPFTIMGTFNRGVTDTNRRTIAAELGQFLGVNEPAPASFDGIPILNNQKSWFFGWARERGEDDIESLWEVFEDAIKLANSDDERASQLFVDSYNQALSVKGVRRNLTIGLFWIRPRNYPTVDGKSETYITDRLGIAIPRIPPRGHEYLELADKLKERFNEANSAVHSFQELSLAAYDEPTTDNPVSPVWLVRAGDKGQDDDADLDNGIKTLGWQEVPDLTGAADRDEIRERVRQGYPDEPNRYIGSTTGQLAAFLLDMREGDIVVLPLKTRPEQVALGRVTGPYVYQEVDGVERHIRPVDWIRPDVPRSDFGRNLQGPLNFNRTVWRMRRNDADRRISAMMDGSRDPDIDTTEAETNGLIQPPLDPPEVAVYTLQDIIAEGCFLEQSKLETILNRLKVKKNLILQGPPGTGKTWLAKKLAFALLGQKDDSRVRRFQFHPNLSYEDFILGYRPNDESKLTLVEGPFLKTVIRAEGDQSNDYVIVIEEINRGNPAQIFGEMLTLLESDKRNSDEALRLAYSSSDADRTVHIPENVYVIGTMNVADRSIALVDLALRRRFAFVDLEPVFGDVWRQWVHEQCGIPLDFLTTIKERMTALNNQIADYPSLGLQFRVGHSYVTPTPGTQIDDPVEWFRDVVDTEIGPLLDEYWFDNADVAQAAKSKLLGRP